MNYIRIGEKITGENMNKNGEKITLDDHIISLLRRETLGIHATLCTTRSKKTTKALNIKYRENKQANKHQKIKNQSR